MIDATLAGALAGVGALMEREARGAWWIIGSAAVALHGADAGTVADIDVLTDRDDAARLLEVTGRQPDAAAPRDLFRSVYGRFAVGAFAVEIMGGLEVARAGRWHRVRPAERQTFVIDGQHVFAPPRDDLIAILRLFGRPKDLARAAALTVV